MAGAGCAECLPETRLQRPLSAEDTVCLNVRNEAQSSQLVWIRRITRSVRRKSDCASLQTRRLDDIAKRQFAVIALPRNVDGISQRAFMAEWIQQDNPERNPFAQPLSDGWPVTLQSNR